MADAVTSQTLIDGGKQVVMKFTNVSDGTGESAEASFLGSHSAIRFKKGARAIEDGPMTTLQSCQERTHKPTRTVSESRGAAATKNDNL